MELIQHINENAHERFSLLSEFYRLAPTVRKSISEKISLDEILSLQGYIVHLLTSEKGIYNSLVQEALASGYEMLRTQADLYRGGNCRIVSKRLTQAILNEHPEYCPQVLSYTPPVQQARGYRHYYVSLKVNDVEIRIDPTWQQFDPNVDDKALPVAFWWGIQTQSKENHEEPFPEFFNHISAYPEFWINATPVVDNTI